MKRDLSGFGFGGAAPAPARPPEPSTRPSAPPPPPPPAKPSQPSRPSAAKKRITLSLPTTVATALRRAADEQERFFLDLVLGAFVEYADAVEKDLQAGAPPARRAAGRTQIPLNILSEDLAVLDERASSLGLDRSAYVAELLIRSLV